MPIVPIAQSLFLCEYHTDYEEGNRSNLHGLFQTITADRGYPHREKQFYVFAHLREGLGDMSFFVDIREASTYELIRTTSPRHIHFSNRHSKVYLYTKLQGVVFPQAGLYLVELYCDNTWVCDTTVVLLD